MGMVREMDPSFGLADMDDEVAFVMCNHREEIPKKKPRSLPNGTLNDPRVRTCTVRLGL